MYDHFVLMYFIMLSPLWNLYQTGPAIAIPFGPFLDIIQLTKEAGFCDLTDL